jgi:hypothetical protein
LLYNTVKIQHILVVTAALLVVGCAVNSDQTIPSQPPSAETPSIGDIVIISATYGSGTNYADVTSRVNYWLRQPDGEFFARPEWLKADPTPGWNKALVIVYECKGHRHIFTTGEGGKVNVAELKAVEM